MSEPRFLDWQALTTTEIRALPAESVAVLALGAIEQHGSHLPLSTDSDIADGLLEAATTHLPTSLPVVRLPTIVVGASDEHLDFPGTLSLPADTAIATLEAYGAAVARAGLERLVLFNAHGGNKAIMDIAALALRRRHGMLVVKAHYMHWTPPDWLPAEEHRHGLHGGALETSLMMHLAPHEVRHDHLGSPTSSGETLERQGYLVGPEGDAAFAWLAEDLHSGGVVGDTHFASQALGERLTTHYAERLAKVLIDTHAMAWHGMAW